MESNDENKDVPCNVDNGSDRIYECKYCDKKFKNKQAFGGHQNAHKNERPVKKIGKRNLHMNSTGNMVGSSSSSSSYLESVNSAPIFGYCNRSHEFIVRPYPQALHNGIHVGHRPRTMVRNVPYICGPNRFMWVQNSRFGWTVPCYCLQDLTQGPSYQDSIFPANGRRQLSLPDPETRPERDGDGDEMDDDSGVDLKLKL